MYDAPMRAHELFALMVRDSESHGVSLLLQKEAINLSSFGQTLKGIALSDVGGPKGFLQPAAQIAAGGKAGTGKLLSSVRRAPVATPRAAGGAWDVSRQARSMGI